MPDKTNDSKEKAHPTRIFQPVAAYQSGTYVTQQVADGLKSQNALMPVISLPLHPTGAREAVSNYLIQRKEDPLSAKSETDLTLAEVQPANHTNLPDGLKTAVEALSGVSLENVRVHYNSSLPAQVNALAYTRGHRIFIAPGQEKHLPHETWHVVQQTLGRVRPTFQLPGGIPVNADQRLEQEAERMGNRALHAQAFNTPNSVAPKQPTAKLPNGELFRSVQFKSLFVLDSTRGINASGINASGINASGINASGINASGIIQRVIKIKDKDYTADQAFSEIVPLLKFETIGNELLGKVVQKIAEYDRQNRTFDDLADLAVSVELDLRRETGAGEPLPDILINDDHAEIILNQEFQEIIKKSNLTAKDQQTLSGQMKKQINFLAEIYKRLYSLIEAEEHSPEKILKWFTEQTRSFTRNIFKIAEDFVGLPRVPVAVMIAGSGAREEMFPGSDLDLAAVMETKNHEEIAAVIDFMKTVESFLNVAVSGLKTVLHTEGEIGLGPDTGVFGFKPSPETLADHTLTLQGTGMDAAALEDPQKAKHGGLINRFIDQRSAKTNEKEALKILYDLLVEFAPPPAVHGKMDIKVQFLRLPTLTLRTLAFCFNLTSTNSFDRIRELDKLNKLDASLAGQMVYALNVIAGIRLKLHKHYQKEEDLFACDAASAGADLYVLTDKELRDLVVVRGILITYHQKLHEFYSKRMKAGMFDFLSSKKIE